MDIHKTTIDIRKRTHWEALDLGLVFIRNSFRKLYVVWFLFTFPVFIAVALFTHFVLPSNIWGILFLFWLKPYFEIIPLFIFSHTLFNEHITYKYIFKNIFPFLMKSMLGNLFFRFILPWRMYIAPVRVLEGVTRDQMRNRIRVIKKDSIGSAVMFFFICLVFEIFIYISFHAIIIIFFSREFNIIFLLFSETSLWISLFILFLYYISLSIIEPFFVASGFSLYINRRVYLEGWDIELDFRRMKKRLSEKSWSLKHTSGSMIIILFLLFFFLLPGPGVFARSPSAVGEHINLVIPDTIEEEIEEIMEMPEFSRYEKKRVIRLKEEFRQENENENDPFENININPIGNFIASLIPWILGIAICGAIIFILFKMNIINIKPGIVKSRKLKSEIESSFLAKITLPPDIIGSAKAEWAGKNIIAAISLLYRGGIYYIVNLKKIMIPDYTTEKENLSIVYRRLKEIAGTETLLKDFSFLTLQWQKCAYAKRFPDDIIFDGLCETWKSYLNEMGRQ